MVELHIVSTNEELSKRNGSAVLTVCLGLQGSAALHGTTALIAGGAGKIVDLDGTVELLAAAPHFFTTSRIGQLLDRGLKYFLGRSPAAPSILGRADLVDVSDIYYHNQPWMHGAHTRTAPNARAHLYVHNQIMKGAPARTIRRVLSQFSSIVCVSLFIERDLQARAKIAPGSELAGKFAVVLNGVDTGRFEGPLGRTTPPECDVAYVGRIVPEKGVHVLADALAQIRHRKMRVTIVGGPSFLPAQVRTDYELAVMKRFAESGVEIHATGPIAPADIPSYMDSAALVVIPSTWQEPGALVLFESMASAAATIASSVGGMPEVGLDSGVVFVPPGDASALGAEIDRLLADDEARRVLAAKGAQWVASRTWTDVYVELKKALAE